MANTDLFSRLKRLFSTGVIVRQVGGKKLKVIDTDNIAAMVNRQLYDRYSRLYTSGYKHRWEMTTAYQAQRLTLFRDYDCVGPDTIIPLPDGTRPTIKELSEKYKDSPQERFHVFSYDHETDTVKLGNAFHPRKKGLRDVWKITLDNDQSIIGSAKHPFLMRNGEYKVVKDLQVGDSVMPFEADIIPAETRIISIIEHIGEMDVYDVTVEQYQNFATDSCFVHNTMDMDPILSAALDIYSDECTCKSELGELLVINSSNSEIQDILHNLFYDILNIEFNLYMWIRNMCKYGDTFLYLDIHDKFGIINVMPLSVYDTVREEGQGEDRDASNPYHVKFKTTGMTGMGISEFENFQIAHFRLLSDSNFLPYGKCVVSSTYVDTPMGSSQIKDLQVGDNVWTFNADTKEFESAKILNKVCSGIKEILKITTPHNFIKCSREHPILVTSVDGTSGYIQAQNIKIGDTLVIANRPLSAGIDYTIDKTVPLDTSCPSFIPETDGVPDIADEEFADFAGFMLGDGWIKGADNPGYCGYRVCFACGVDDVQNEKYRHILEKYAGKPVKYFATGKNGSGKSCLTYSKRLYYILKNSGLSGSAKTKRIPQWIFNASPSIQLAFINGLVNADGSVNIDKWGVVKYVLDLTNENLILDC